MLYAEAKKAHIRKIESNYYEEKLRDSRKKNEENSYEWKGKRDCIANWELDWQLAKHVD